MKMHDIDKPGKEYSDEELEGFMVFCILDTMVPYETVCKCFDLLKQNHYITRNDLTKFNEPNIAELIRKGGHRFWKTKAKWLVEFGQNDIDLRNASREDIVKNIRGVGMKLASMFLRNTRGLQYAVLDVHTLRWLKQSYNFPDEEFKKMTYEEKEKWFVEAAEFLGMTPTELDLKIWNENRVGNKIDRTS